MRAYAGPACRAHGRHGPQDQVACDSRSSSDFLIIARTDARTGHGLDEAIRRGAAYAEAGADIVFVESPESEAELVEIARRIDKPLVANMVVGGRTPMLPASRLAEIGFAMAIFPATGFLAAAEALQRAYTDLQQHGNVDRRRPDVLVHRIQQAAGL